MEVVFCLGSQSLGLFYLFVSSSLFLEALFDFLLAFTCILELFGHSKFFLFRPKFFHFLFIFNNLRFKIIQFVFNFIEIVLNELTVFGDLAPLLFYLMDLFVYFGLFFGGVFHFCSHVVNFLRSCIKVILHLTEIFQLIFKRTHLWFKLRF